MGCSLFSSCLPSLHTMGLSWSYRVPAMWCPQVLYQPCSEKDWAYIGTYLPGPVHVSRSSGDLILRLCAFLFPHISTRTPAAYLYLDLEFGGLLCAQVFPRVGGPLWELWPERSYTQSCGSLVSLAPSGWPPHGAQVNLSWFLPQLPLLLLLGLTYQSCQTLFLLGAGSEWGKLTARCLPLI